MQKRINYVITVSLLGVVLAAFLGSAIFTYILLLNESDDQAKTLLRQHVEDISNDIDDLADKAILEFIDQFIYSGYVSSANISDPTALSEDLHKYYSTQGIEVSVIDQNGFIIASSEPEYIGFDMSSGEQSAAFLVLLDDQTDSYVQDMSRISYDNSSVMKYAGKSFPDGSGFLQVGLSDSMYHKDISKQGKFAATNRHIGKTGYLLICDQDLNIISSYHSRHTGRSLEESGIELDTSKEYLFEDIKSNVYGSSCFVQINYVRGIFVIGVYPEKEALRSVHTMMRTTLAFETVIFTILFVTLIILLKKLIIDNIHKVNKALSQISEGNLDEKIEVREIYEFAELSTDINTTVARLKDYIKEAAERINADLAVAKEIQTSALPSVFPPYPERTDFELYAYMNAAKEVGGDFYDFFMLGTDMLAFLIADVSGKSIPGAMIMMRGKTVIKSLAESGLSPEEVFTVANEKLIDGNEAGLFITALMGYLDLKSGILRVVNAGHNPPILIRDGKAEYVTLEPNLMLAGMDDMTYTVQNMQLEPGDIFYLYTDGVTEAMNETDSLYGEERLKKLLSFGNVPPLVTDDNGIPGAICDEVIKDVNAFTNGAEQSDDITMLCVRYIGDNDSSTGTVNENEVLDKQQENESQNRITLQATTENVDDAVSFVEEFLDSVDAGMEIRVSLDTAVDEIFSNIALYAYEEGTGDATIDISSVPGQNAVKITFIDSGIPYDPLKKDDPDTSLSLDERKIGGLGIFIVKQSMDDVYYEYKDGQNMFTIVKNL